MEFIESISFMLKQKGHKLITLKKILLTCLIFCLLNTSLSAANHNMADPDIISTGVSFSWVPTAKIGDFISFYDIDLGGFLETRNESRFNQGVLPNHNWRGFAFIKYNLEVKKDEDQTISIDFGVEHESAHPTMGFTEFNDSAYELIYDGLYRNINLNSLLMGYKHSFGKDFKLKFMFDYQVYFFSKNTPELHNTDLALSHGFSPGVEFILPFYKSFGWYISIFDRYIFQSREKRDDLIYYDEDGSVVQRISSYPIINNVNTISIKTGLLYFWTGAGRKVNLYTQLLYGNIFGFVDSRDNRLKLYFGVELLQI